MSGQGSEKDASATGGVDPEPAKHSTTGGVDPEPGQHDTTGGVVPEPAQRSTEEGTDPTPAKRSTTEGADPPPAKRRRGKAHSWELLKKFPDMAAFQPWMENQIKVDGLVKSTLSKGQTAEKRVYKCKSNVHHGCEYKLRAEMYQGETGIEVQWNGKPHQHEKKATEEVGDGSRKHRGCSPIDQASKAVIKKGLKDGLTAGQIRKKLSNDGLPVPSKVKLSNCIAYLRRKRGGLGCNSRQSQPF